MFSSIRPTFVTGALAAQTVGVLFAIVACSRSAGPPPNSPAPAVYRPAFDPLIGPVWIQATRAYVVAKCNNVRLTDTPTNGDVPGVHIVDAGGVEVRQWCGLVAHEVYTPVFMERFARDVCGLDDGAMDQGCNQRFAEMFIARLSERYASADWAAVAQRCTAYPFECNTPVAIETKLIAAHNKGVEAWYTATVRSVHAQHYSAMQQQAATQQQLAEQRRADRRKFWGNVGTALSAMGQGMAPRPTVNCTSNQVGSTTYTNCR